MHAVIYRYRATFRQNWRSWATLAVLTGIALSVALAAAANARRTDTALPRALAAGNSADVSVSGDQGTMGRSPALLYLDEVEHLSGVQRSSRNGGVYLAEVSDGGEIRGRLSFGSALGRLIERPTPTGPDTLRLLKGRPPQPERPDEVLVNPELQRITGWKIGDRVTTLQLFRLEALTNDGEPDPTKGKPLELTIVGVGRLPYELFDAADERNPQVYLFPAFAKSYPDSTYYVSTALRISGGADKIVDFRSQVEKLTARYEGARALVQVRHDSLTAVQDALRPQVSTIWLLAAVLLVSGLLLGAQAIGRQVLSQNRDAPALSALGMSTRDLGVLVLLHAATIAAGAAIVAGLCGWLSSSFTPFGATREIEPDPGTHFDAAVFVVGALGIAVALACTASLSATRLTRVTARRTNRSGFDARARPSKLVGVLTRTGFPPTVVTGSRFALQPGTRPSTTPSRSVLWSIAIAVAVVSTAVSFASSLNRLISTPSRYGWDWDLGAVNGFGPIPDDAVEMTRARPEVSAIAAFNYGNVRIDGRSVSVVALDQLDGTVFPTLDEGRIPQGESDIVLGRLDLQALGRSIGDRIDVDTGNGTRKMTIVGTATFPSIGNTRTRNTGLGRGAATVASLFPPADDPSEGHYNGLLLRIDPSLNRAKAVSSLKAFFGELGCADSGCLLTDGKPESLNGYESLGSIWMPFALALGVVFTISLAHGIATTTRARRRELAILAALGMTRRQGGRVALWQATTIIVAALVIGVPSGVFGANALWRVFSDRLGIQPQPSVPLLQLALLALGAVVGAVVVGSVFVPATRRATSAGLSAVTE